MPKALLKNPRRLLLSITLAATGLLAVVAQATNYSLWINGRTGGGQVHNHADFTY